MDLSPLSGEQQEVLIGLLLGVGVALFAQYLFPWRNLRWTWALFAVPIGGVALLAGVVESWSVALPLCGLVTARWAYVLERRKIESGGDARRRVRDAVGPIDVLAKQRSLRRVRQGIITGPGEFLLGHNRRSQPVSLRLGRASGRHGLLLGASGSGKSNALLWCLARHIDAGFGVVVIDMKGDQLLSVDRTHGGRAAEATVLRSGRWTAAIAGTRSRAATAAS